MPHVLELKDGKIITPLDIRDVLEAVEEYAGSEVRAFLEENISELKELEAELEKAEKEHDEEIEQLNDHQRSVLNDIKEEAEAIEDLLDAERLDRKKLKKAVNKIWGMCYGEL